MSHRAQRYDPAAIQTGDLAEVSWEAAIWWIRGAAAEPSGGDWVGAIRVLSCRGKEVGTPGEVA